MLLIQASNIHTGGGATLLRPLLQAGFTQARCVWVDERFKLPDQLAADVEVIRVRPSVADRLRADAEVARRAKPCDVLLCLGNLPPIRRAPCKTIVYLQNRYLIGNAAFKGILIRERFRLMVERLWLRTLTSHAQLYLVQTPSMRLAALDHLGLDEAQVKVAPYLPGNAVWPRSLHSDVQAKLQDDRPFLYVASGEHHKNHSTLVQAWILLAAEGLFPRLQLTVSHSRFPVLTKWITKRIHQYGLRLEIDATYQTENIGGLYGNARALIFPSYFESFGLPLIEARQAGLPILASELDYVRDVIDPDVVFDPCSARSMARAVKRFMGLAEPVLPALGPEQFMQMLRQECQKY